MSVIREGEKFYLVMELSPRQLFMGVASHNGANGGGYFAAILLEYDLMMERGALAPSFRETDLVGG